MKFKFIPVLALSWVAATAACAPLQKTYWQRVDNDSALYLTGPKATEKLDQDIATCTHEVEEVVELDKLRETMPPDTAGVPDNEGILTYYDTPTRVGEQKVSHTDFHDFESCMLSAGWVRQKFVRYPEMAAADNNYMDLQSMRQTGMTVNEKKASDAAIVAARNDALVKTGSQFSFGLQGYHDRYNESSVGVNVETRYFGVTAGYTRRDTLHDFWTVDGRVAHGTESYNSPSGTLSGVPEYEGEIRLTGGKDFALDNGWISPYAGLGTRIFRGDGKGYVTDLGKFAYDRRIEQLYLPLGVTWRSLLFERVSMSNNLEVEPLLIGRVNSRLQNVDGPNIVNTQNIGSGFGVRGEMMFGVPTQNQSIEMGPFFRYWNINDSTLKITNDCTGNLCLSGLEPGNTRLQVGLTGRISF